ncbi:thyroid hormone receptor-associated protein 3 isoform X3 [Megalops cyprinoides]|uniref:thyroid hormone receptor-associated protein 3 isoform X3 n=1 Tax=Megalops cyprinoides TaxID=118141 RepID=UPI001864DE76|nr:thyroid hormone receptor-associated protein 3 isoform X3 [Megalops cyprinoides]
MKKRTGSRSRSRSRSHSPAHNRDRNYPREYQNNREFRGYHRGFRRPYYYRGRGRGYFPRGRYQRGGGGGYNNNYRPNNWQNYRQHPQQPPAPHHQHSPRRGRSRSRTPKKRSGSPRSRSRSRYSDRSSSGRSRRSRGSSSSSSRSSSPRRRSGSGSAKRGSKDVKDRSASKEAAQSAGRAGDGEAEPAAGGGASGGAAGEDGSLSDRPTGNWQGLTDYSTSPKRASPQLRSAIIISQGASVSSQPSPSPKSSNASNSATPWSNVGTAPSSKSPPEKSPTAGFSGFGFFSKEDHRAGEKTAISKAFKKFLEEHKSKKQASEWENGRDKDPNDGEAEREKGIFDRGPAYGGGSKGGEYGASKAEKEKYKYGEGFEAGPSSAGFMKAPPFLCGDGEEDEEEEEEEPRPKARKEREGEDEPKPKTKVTLSARELFEERFGKWDDLAYFPSAKERSRKEADPGDDDLDDIEEELYRSRKQERAAALAAALAKKEAVALFRGFSPDKLAKGRKKEKAGQSPSPPPRRSSETRDRDTFMVRKDDSPVRASGKRGAEFGVRMDSFRDDIASSSGVLANERRISRDLVHPVKKDQEFRSIFQHIQSTQLRRSPSELFAQHIVTIVHHIKAQHFPSPGITLNERFAMYQRRAAEKEMAKPRKSPEIHRRIDVSPSAFKKHSHLFEDMKAPIDGSYKDEGKKMKGDSMDLRLDIERRKKYSSKERDHKRDGGRDSADSRASSRERSTEKSSKHHKKAKKSKKKRERSRSSSASSSSSHSHRVGDYPHEDMEPKEEGFNKARLGPRDYGGPMERGRARGGFQFRIRGRSWNRGNYPGNNSNGNPQNMGMPMHPKNEDWDPEYTPKSRKYYLHDDREGEGEKKWLDNRGRGRGNFVRGRGRFIFRKTTTSSSSPKWTHDKFQGSGEEGELRDEDSEQDHKEEDKAVGTAGSEQ